MFVVIWRYSARSEWLVSNKPLPDEQAARAEINSMMRYDVSGRREYRIAEVGDADSWIDPVAEDAVQDAAENAGNASGWYCANCGDHWPKDKVECPCGSTSQTNRKPA